MNEGADSQAVEGLGEILDEGEIGAGVAGTPPSKGALGLLSVVPSHTRTLVDDFTVLTGKVMLKKGLVTDLCPGIPYDRMTLDTRSFHAGTRGVILPCIQTTPFDPPGAPRSDRCHHLVACRDLMRIILISPAMEMLWMVPFRDRKCTAAKDMATIPVPLGCMQTPDDIQNPRVILPPTQITALRNLHITNQLGQFP